MIFSEKYGFRPRRTEIQIDAMDDPLRNALWNLLLVTFPLSGDVDLWYNLAVIWYRDVKKGTMDSVPDYFDELLRGHIKGLFLKAEFNEIYDYYQYVINDWDNLRKLSVIRLKPLESIINELNNILEANLAAYRFVKSDFVRITDLKELEEIETAIEASVEGGFNGVAKHLEKAASFLGPGSKADYENSVKESISAVESLVLTLTEEKRGKFERPVRILADRLNIHRALAEGLVKLYGYASAEEGARHCVLDGSAPVNYEEAHFMLVVCSATVNYILGKRRLLLSDE